MNKGLFGRLKQELEGRERAASLTLVDMLRLPDPLRRLAQWLMREGEVALPAVIAQVAQDEATVQTMLQSLIDSGFVRATSVNGEQRYSLRINARRSRAIPLDLWAAVRNKIDQQGED